MTLLDWLMVVGVVIAIISTQFTKWEDRKDGKRWWEDTKR